jgi:hypothetical protein
VAAPIAAALAVYFARPRDWGEFAGVFVMFFVGALVLVGPATSSLGQWIWPESHNDHVRRCCLDDHLERAGQQAFWNNGTWKQHAGHCSLCNPNFGRAEPEDFKRGRAAAEYFFQRRAQT